jgi:Fe-S cluster assembly iron-binding protein IscA
MSKLFIDDRAIEFIKKALAKENTPAMRIFISGGGCCKQFEMAPVKKALAGDVTFTQDGLTVHIEKELADNTGYIGIKFDEQRGLLVELE